MAIMVTDRVGVDLKREYFTLYRPKEDENNFLYFDYGQAQALLAALTVVVKSQPYLDYMGAKLNALKQGTP